MSYAWIALAAFEITLLMGMLSHLTAAPQDVKREGRIALEVKSAKSHGQNNVELVAPIGMPTGISTVDDVLNHYSVVIAELVGKRVGADADDVNTWYKFRISELLAEQPNNSLEALTDRVPQDLLPMQPEEFLILQNGGKIVVDGVTVTETPRNDLSFDTPNRYVLFLHFESSSKVASLAADRASAFLITAEGELAALTKRPHPLVKDVQVQYNNRLDWLRDDAKARMSRRLDPR